MHTYVMLSASHVNKWTLTLCANQKPRKCVALATLQFANGGQTYFSFWPGTQKRAVNFCFAQSVRYIKMLFASTTCEAYENDRQSQTCFFLCVFKYNLVYLVNILLDNIWLKFIFHSSISFKPSNYIYHIFAPD